LKANVWNKDDLIYRLSCALDIAEMAVRSFAIDGYVDTDAPENSFKPEKVVAETAMLLYSASVAIHFSDIAKRVDRIGRLLVPYARSQQTLLNIALHPSLCIDYAIPHILLTKLGYSDQDFDDFLKCCLSSQSRNGHERPPFASMEQNWIKSIWLSDTNLREWKPTLRKSVLYRPIDILGGLHQDAYAFTHLVMYCTDFGFRSPIFPRPKVIILSEAQSLLAKCLDNEDYDLAAELVLAWPLSGSGWSAAATFCFHVLAHVEDRVGVLPAKITRPDRLEKLKGKERTNYALGTGYHTALVMGLLSAACLRPGRTPDNSINGPRFEKSFLKILLDSHKQDQGHWQVVLSGLTESEQCKLVPFLLDILIIQKFRGSDYNEMATLLKLAYEYNIATSPLCVQAAELLERLTAYSKSSQAVFSRNNLQQKDTTITTTKRGIIMTTT
jgi:hypothetical protein